MSSSKTNVIYLLIVAILAGSLRPVQAQIIPDDTLGDEASQVSVDATVQGLPTDLIEGGATRGVNLFHSFSDFNVADLQRVYFANPASIENILSRVTGANRSDIFGTLGVDGSANLFLLNPNGIVFGENAQLDITGSFFASTADALELGDGLSYSAVEPTAPPLLAVTLTPGLQYGAAQQGEISNTGTLQTGEGLTLSADTLILNGSLLAGADLTLRSSDTIQIRDSETQPFIAAAIGDVLVQGDQTVDIFALNHSDSGLFAGKDLILRSANSIIGDTHYWSGNRFQVETLAGVPGNLLSPNDPVIQSGGDISFANYTGASLRVLAGGSVTANNITITGTDPGFPDETVALSRPLADGTTTVQVNGSTRPVVDIRAGTTAATGGLSCDNCPSMFGISQPTNLLSTALPSSANINIESISINRPDGLVLLTNQFQPANTLTGDILVETIRTDDRSSGLLSAFQGNGGDIFLDSRNNIQFNGGCFLIQCVVQTSSATGDSGDISLLATEDIFVTGGTIVSTETPRGNGQAGNIEIQGNSITLSEGSQLIADTEGQGNAGNINIFGRENVDVLIDQSSFSPINTAIGSRVRAGAVGNAGTVRIRANNFNLEGQIQTIVQGRSFFSPGGNGNGGNVILEIKDKAKISGQFPNLTTGIFTLVQPGATGTAGNIIINSDSLIIENTSFGGLDTSLRGEGSAGNIDIRLNDELNLSNRSFIAAPVFASGVGNGGSISVSALNINLSDFSQILTTSVGSGNSGNLSVSAQELLSIENQSAISSGVISSEGTAGNLFIGADILSLQNESIITSSTAGAGDAGQLNLQVNEINLNRGSITASSEGTGNAGKLSILNADKVFLENGSEISTGSINAGQAGDISIDSTIIRLRDNSVLLTATVGAGNAGELNIQADLVELVNSSRISTETGASNVFVQDLLPVSTGDAGPITIKTNRLILRDGEIATSANLGSRGRAGALTINASESIDIGGISETTLGGLRAFAFGTEQGGNIFIDTGRLVLQDGGRIDAGTAGLGNGGNVIVNARESIDIGGASAPLTSEQIEALVSAGLVTVIGNRSNETPLPSGISSFNIDGFVRNEIRLALGDARSGNVELSTPSLTVRDGAEISTAVLGDGDGGFIKIDAESMNLRNTARIVSRSEGRGQAGDIVIDLDEQLQINGGEISASSDLAGGGNLNIETDNFLFSNGSLISTSVFDSTGGGGNITIDANAFAAIEDSDILANAEFGPGGSININSPAFLAALFDSGRAIPVGRNPGSFAQFRGNNRVDISADSAGGQSGTVSLSTLVTDEGLNELPTDLIDPTSLIDQRCDLLASQQSQDDQSGQFTVVGRGGLPLTPEQQLEATHLLDDLGPPEMQRSAENVNAEVVTAASAEVTSERIVEPLGWRRSEDGRLYLYASASAAETAETHLAQRCAESPSANRFSVSSR